MVIPSLMSNFENLIFLSIQRLLKMVDGLNFKDFVAFLSAFSAKASMQQKIERRSIGLNFSLYVNTLFHLFIQAKILLHFFVRC